MAAAAERSEFRGEEIHYDLVLERYSLEEFRDTYRKSEYEFRFDPLPELPSGIVYQCFIKIHTYDTRLLCGSRFSKKIQFDLSRGKYQSACVFVEYSAREVEDVKKIFDSSDTNYDRNSRRHTLVRGISVIKHGTSLWHHRRNDHLIGPTKFIYDGYQVDSDVSLFLIRYIS